MDNAEVKKTNLVLSLEELVSEFNQGLVIHRKQRLYRFTIEAIEKQLIEKTLERTFGNQLKAAKLLGLNRNTLRNRIKKFNINVNKWKLR